MAVGQDADAQHAEPKGVFCWAILTTESSMAGRVLKNQVQA